MDTKKFQFLFVYDDNTESIQLEIGKRVKAIRISENCRLSTDFIIKGKCSASQALAFAKEHNVHLLTPKEIRIVQHRLSGVRMMLKKCQAAHQIDHQLLVWTADNTDSPVEHLEACSLSSGKTVLFGCHAANKYCTALYKL